VILVAGEIQRRSGNPEGAGVRARDALSMAKAVDNQAFMMRALRLLGQLLVDRRVIERGLGILAFVLDRAAGTGGDFTSEIINPRVWNEAIAGADREAVDAARAWAKAQDLDTIVAVLDSP
jgi:hypothetical protein